MVKSARETESRFGPKGLRTIKRMKGEERRELIRNVALRLFHSRGYQHTSMETIAREVGIQKASLYYYFRSKEQILIELHEEMIDLIIGQQSQRAEAMELRPSEMLLAVMTDLVSLQETHPGQLKIFFEHYRELPEDVRATISEKRDRYKRSVLKVLNDGMRSGDFVIGDIEMTCMAVLGMCNWTYQWFRTNRRLDAKEIAAAFWKVLLQGIAT